MAGDWIKMRCDLQSHPKVVRILSAIKADKFRVIGGLHAVWSVFDAHSEDGVLHGYTLDLMDHIIGWEGFSSAVASVGWLSEGADETLVMPEFTEHNGQSGKRRAEDQKRKRVARKSVRILSAECPKKSGPEKRREEKRREGTKHKHLASKPAKVSVTAKDLADDYGVDSSIAAQWLAVRSKKRMALTPAAMAKMQSECTKAGITIADAAAICAENAWAGFKSDYLIRGGQENAKYPRRDGQGGLSLVEKVAVANGLNRDGTPRRD